MATTSKARSATQGLSRDQLVAAYRTMLLSRRIDDKEIQLKRQNKIFFQISGAGHEAVLTAAGMVLQAGIRLVLPLLPRPRALPAARRDAGRDAVRGGRRGGGPELGRAADAEPLGAQGRSTSSPRRRRRARSSCRRSGSAEASLRAKLLGITEGFHERRGRARLHRRRHDVSEGEFWESLNTAANLKLPVVYLVEDNGYAISVPVEVNTAGRIDLEARAVVPRAVRPGGRRLRPARVSYEAMQKRGRLRPQAEGPGARARARDPPVLALALGRRGDVPPAGGARGRRGARSGRDVPEVARRRRACDGGGDRDDPGRRSTPIVLAATDDALAQPQPGARDGLRLRLLARRRSDERAVRHRGRSAVRGQRRRRWSTCSTRA